MQRARRWHSIVCQSSHPPLINTKWWWSLVNAHPHYHDDNDDDDDDHHRHRYHHDYDHIRTNIHSIVCQSSHPPLINTKCWWSLVIFIILMMMMTIIIIMIMIISGKNLFHDPPGNIDSFTCFAVKITVLACSTKLASRWQTSRRKGVNEFV